MSEIDDLKGRIEELESEIKDLESDCDGYNETIDDLESDICRLESNAEDGDNLKLKLAVLCDSKSDQARFDKLFSDLIYDQLGRII